jgi:phenylacetic acid degradation operon negative regulatory protein
VKPRPKSVVLDLLSTLQGHPAPVRFLVAAAEIFDIDSNATRVAITRLLACGLIERDDRGAYRTGAAAAPVQARLLSWRNIADRLRPWSNEWMGVAPLACCCSKESRAWSIHALEFVGMRELSPGCWIRPDNLEGGVAAVRAMLQNLGLAAGSPVFSIRDFDAEGEAMARSLWDSEAIRENYRRIAGGLQASAANLHHLAEREAMAETFLLGGEAIRRIVLDPLLPDPIIPSAERLALVEAMIRYDEVGRRVWAPFVQRYGLRATSSPTDSQGWREPASLALGEYPIPNGESS